MREIDANGQRIRALLSQKYLIDYYQREYNWEARQIKELVEDLTDRFLLDYNETHEQPQVADYGQYFLGSIIVTHKDNRRYIVDGQQRLTSLTLLLIYLERLQRDLPNDRRNKDILPLIYSTQFGQKSFNLDIPERNDCMQKIMNGEDLDPTGQPPSIQNLILRYNDIEDCFPERLEGKALQYFIDWLMEKVTLVEIIAFADDDSYTIFETMNDRGLSLSPTDMLKGYLLSNITSESSRAAASDVWKANIARLTDLGKEEDADCIKAWLRSQHAQDIRERQAGAQAKDFEKIGTEFHRWIKDNQNPLQLTDSTAFESFIKDTFPFFSRAYIFARGKAANYDPQFGAIYFNSQNSFTLQYPLLLAPLQRNDSWDIVMRKMRLVATFIEILLARRIWNFRAIDYSTMQYRAFLIMKSIRALPLESLRSELIGQLTSNGDDPLGFDNLDEPFRLHGSNGPQVHRILARMTDFIEVGSKEASRYAEYTVRSWRRDGYQIEHIWANHYERHSDEFAHPADFAAYRNRIGGLVLLPGPDNASYSDMTYTDKVEHYTKQNLLACSLNQKAYEANPRFVQFVDATGIPFQPKAKFGKAELDERQQLYSAIARNCWSPDQLNEI